MGVAALESGTRLGGYTVVGLLGSGAMGEVYRARDERLGRDVAIKVIARALASNDKELARFAREARSLAALSHPNILGIFDFGEQDGVNFAVMELLEGTSLRERLRGGPLPWRTAGAIASAAAMGAAAAHVRGIVHRDLKPENIFLLADGGVKVLDFGLARRDEAPNAPTPEEETLIGTVVYMAPEQILRRPADARTDIFALGVVLFEMLAGNGPFARSTVGETIGAILTEDPPALVPRGGAAPPALERIVRRCLAKDPELRFQSAYDLVFALGEVAAPHPAARPARSQWAVRAAILLAGALVGAAVTALLLLWR